MRPLWRGLVVFFLWVTAGPARAQLANGLLPGLDHAPFLAAAMSEVFSDSRAFSAVALAQLPGRSPGQALPLGFATSKGRMRWYLNLERAQGLNLEPEVASLLREAKLGQILLLLRPETNAVVAIPGLKAWFELPMPVPQSVKDKAQEKAGFLQKTEVGREMVEGHPCVKYRLHNAGGKDSQEEAFVWQATDLKNLPIRFQARIHGEQYGLLFRDVRQSEPDPKLFDPPTGYTKIAGPEVLLQSALLRQMPGIGAGGVSIFE